MGRSRSNLERRILTAADSYEAMTADRPYRNGLSSTDAVAELRRCAGTQFDPRVVDVFLAAYPFATRETERLVGRLSGFAGVLELN